MRHRRGRAGRKRTYLLVVEHLDLKHGDDAVAVQVQDAEPVLRARRRGLVLRVLSAEGVKLGPNGAEIKTFLFWGKVRQTGRNPPKFTQNLALVRTHSARSFSSNAPLRRA